MKKKTTVIICLALCALMLCACGHGGAKDAPATPSPTVTAAPPPVVLTPAPMSTPMPTYTPAPTYTPMPTYTPAPTPASSLPLITKSPTGETINANGSCMFITRYENADAAEWHFVSPDGWRDLDYRTAQREFPTLKINGGNTKDLSLESVPEDFNGWKVYCRFTNRNGSASSASAQITVLPVPDDQLTGKTMTVYYENGSSLLVAEFGDGTWRTWEGAVYYLGTDGILRGRNNPDLYTYVPSGTSSGSSADASQSTGRTMTVYYSDGTSVLVREAADGTWLTPSEEVYYLGDDGTLRCTGEADLYTSDPSPASEPSVYTLTAYYADGTPEFVTQNSDGTWTSSGGTIYYLGADGVMRASGAGDLFAYNPVW